MQISVFGFYNHNIPEKKRIITYGVLAHLIIKNLNEIGHTQRSSYSEEKRFSKLGFILS